MSWNTAKAVMDWFIKDASGDSPRLFLTFFGGEPLLEFPLIQKMVSYGRSTAEDMGKSIEFSATTNGSLFTEEVAEFWKDNRLSLLLSVDGAPASQDKERLTKGKTSSSLLLERAFPLIRDAVDDCTVRMTVTPQNADHILENLDYLHQKGFKHLAHYPVELGWDREALYRLDKAYRAGANWYLRRLAAGDHVSLSLYSLIARRIIEWREMREEERSAPHTPCGAGKGYLGVGVDGSIYPCHRFVSLDNFAGRFVLGDVFKGIDPRVRNQFVRITNRSMLGCHTVCDSCVARSICMGGCLVQNLTITGEMLMPMPAQQFISTMYFEIVSDMLDALEKRHEDLLPIFLRDPAEKRLVVEPDIATIC